MSWRDEFETPDSRYTVDHVEELLEFLRDGLSMREICAREHMPSRETVRLWCDADSDLALAITRAREIGYCDRAERAVEDAKKADDPQKGRLAFDAERWFLGKTSKGFADKVVVTGEKDGPAINIQQVNSDAADFTRSIISLAARIGKSEISGQSDDAAKG